MLTYCTRGVEEAQGSGRLHQGGEAGVPADLG